jgi:hypothetical protein
MYCNAAIWAALAVALGYCAGRDSQPVATEQASTCTQIRAEIEANNAKAKQLAEQGLKVAQNVGAAVVGVGIWPVWFAMDFIDAAGREAAALQARRQYLTTLATDRMRAAAAPAEVRELRLS